MVEDDVEQFIRQRDAALIALDIGWARKFMPGASSDDVRLMAMHKARYELPHLPAEVRHASSDWLRARGHGRMNGAPLLPEGRLPA